MLLKNAYCQIMCDFRLNKCNTNHRTNDRLIYHTILANDTMNTISYKVKLKLPGLSALLLLLLLLLKQQLAKPNLPKFQLQRKTHTELSSDS